MIYTQTELEIVREAQRSKGLLSAMWVTGKGPRGGKVSVGKGRYDLLNLMVIEGKAEVLLRFRNETEGDTGKLQSYGLMVKVKRVKKGHGKMPSVEERRQVNVVTEEKPPWE